MAAAVGNQYAAKAKQWSLAIERALAKRSKRTKVEALDALAEKLLEKCDEGDMAALKELGDRLDGKPAQAVAATMDGTVRFELLAPWLTKAIAERNG